MTFLLAPTSEGASIIDVAGLKPGESKVATMALDRDSLAAWDTDTNGWKVYPSVYSVMVGSSSRDIALRGSFTIAGSKPYGATHEKLAASSVPPVPVYLATFGNWHNGRVRIMAP